MLEKVISFILNQDRRSLESEQSSDFSPLELNTALLMIDVAGSDHDLSEPELELIRQFLTRQFSLNQADVGTLLDEARQLLNDQTDLWEPVSLLNAQLNSSQKMELLINLWRIVFSDARLDGHEDHLMHKIADLLKLDHDDLIRCKLSAKQQ